MEIALEVPMRSGVDVSLMRISMKKVCHHGLMCPKFMPCDYGLNAYLSRHRRIMSVGPGYDRHFTISSKFLRKFSKKDKTGFFSSHMRVAGME